MHLSRLHFCILFSLFVSSFNLHALPLFINEFHYDNAGADVGEFVEISGLAGLDLNGWRLEFYNGTNGKIYSSWNLSGLITDQSNGYGALAFTGSTMLQNGSRDGIALIDDLGLLVQFLSYEGLLTATNGAALGHTSIDVGVSEGGSTLAGYSIQLEGMGQNEQDFIWSTGLSSFGQLNTGQTFVPSMPVDVVQPTIVPAVSVSEPGMLGILLLSLVVLFFRQKILSVSNFNVSLKAV